MPSRWTVVHYHAFKQAIQDHGYKLIRKYRPSQTQATAGNFIKEWAQVQAFRAAASELENGIRDFDTLPGWVDAGVVYKNYKVLESNGWRGLYQIIGPNDAIGDFASPIATFSSAGFIPKTGP